MNLSVSILSSPNRIACIKALNQTTIDYFHIDVMDGIFVNNFQMPIEEIEELAKYTRKPLDIHLMVENPIKYIEDLSQKNIKAEYITFHVEVAKNKIEIISKIKAKGYKVGLSIKPNTNLEEIIPYLPLIDLLLVMSVEPGKGGQEFISSTLEKISKLKKIIDKLKKEIVIEVDGGINNNNVESLKKVGTDIIVSGSYIVKSENFQNQINKLKI